MNLTDFTDTTQLNLTAVLPWVERTLPSLLLWVREHPVLALLAGGLVFLLLYFLGNFFEKFFLFFLLLAVLAVVGFLLLNSGAHLQLNDWLLQLSAGFS